MNALFQLILWLWKAWPLWAVIMTGVFHYAVYYSFPANGELINKIVSFLLQLVGGMIVLYSVNENMGMFKRGSLLSLIGQWFKSFPLIKRSVTLSVNGSGSAVASGSPTITTKRKFNTVEERLDELERQIDESRQLIFEREKIVMERISSVQSALESSISQNSKAIQDVRKLLDDSLVGGIKAQLFGVLLVLYGAVLRLISGPSSAAAGPPEFKDLPAVEQFAGKPAPVDLKSGSKARRFRTVLRDGAKTGPNFAGHYTVVKWGCGTACAEFAIVDAKTGRVYFPTTIKFNSYALVHDGTEPFQFQKDSALFIIVGEPDETDKLGVYYYKWTGSDLKLIHKVERTFEPK